MPTVRRGAMADRAGAKWLPVAWMIANNKNGASSYETAWAIGVTQKTAWSHAVAALLSAFVSGARSAGGRLCLPRRHLP